MYKWADQKKEKDPKKSVATPQPAPSTQESSAAMGGDKAQENKVQAPIRDIYQPGWFTKEGEASEGAAAIEKRIGRKVQPMPSPNPWQIFPLKMGHQTNQSRALGEQKARAAESKQPLIVHAHSQGTAQDAAANEHAINLVTKPPSEAMMAQAREEVPEGSSSGEVDYVGFHEDPRVVEVTREDLVNRKGQEYARKKAERKVGKHNHGIYSGAATYPHPAVPTSQINRVHTVHASAHYEDGMPIPGTEHVFKHNSDIVPLMTAPSQSEGPNHKVTKIEGGPGLHEHAFIPNYADADAEETKIVEKRWPPRPQAPAGPDAAPTTRSSGGGDSTSTDSESSDSSDSRTSYHNAASGGRSLFRRGGWSANHQSSGTGSLPRSNPGGSPWRW